MTTITANSTIGIVLTSVSYASPIVIEAAIGVSAGGSAVYAPAGYWKVQNYGSISSTGSAASAIGIELAAGGSVTNATSASITGFQAVVITGGLGTVLNAGTIAGNGTTGLGAFGVFLGDSGTVSNSATGLISSVSEAGVYANFHGASRSTVTNEGTITGASEGVGIGTGGEVENKHSGTIIGDAGIFADSSPLTVLNSGIVTGTGVNGRAVELGASGSVTNFASGSIVGVDDGVSMAGGPSTVVNYGYIAGSGTYGAGIFLNSGGMITNETSALIAGHREAIGIAQDGTLVNDGSITSASGPGVKLLNGGVITNSSSGTIASLGDGVLAYGGTTTLTNWGAITGIYRAVELKSDVGTVINYGSIGSASTNSLGVELLSGGVVTNATTGTITSGYHAVEIAGSAGTVDNAGEIVATGTASRGVKLRAGGLVVNEAGASITSATRAPIFIYGGDGTLTNAGTIIGSAGVAVTFKAGFGNRVVVDPGAIFSGKVDGGNTIGATAVSTLELASGGGRGTLSGLGAQYVNFAQTTVDTSAYWLLTGTNSIGSGATLTNLGTLDLASASLTDSGTLTNDGGIVLDPSALSADDLTGTGSVTIDAGSTLNALGTVGSGQTMSFNGGYLHLYQPTSAAGSVVNFGAGDTIDLTGIAPASVTYASGALDFTGGSFPLDVVPGNTLHIAASADGAELTALCFCAGTMILTPSGERRVQELAVGDLVTTASGATRRIAWIGTGKVLATRGRRNAATPVIVRKNALAPNVPSRDLHLTKGHCLYLDAVLIPVEQLINHRSITWDDRAQQVELFHIELATHDVLLADGAPAESYRDDGNRWLFRNANSGWHLPAQQPCAPLLTGGPIVDAIWRRLLDRAGPRPGLPLTADADLHLVVDGERIDIASRSGDVVAFHLAQRPKSVRIVSRAAAPDQLGLTRDPRELGVALRRITLKRGHRHTSIEAEDARLAAGFHPFEPADAIRWTHGDAVVPTALFADMNRPALLLLQLGCRTRYIADEPTDRAA